MSSQRLNIKRAREQNPIVSVFLQSNPQRIYSITVPTSKLWNDFVCKIKNKFNLDSNVNMDIYLCNDNESIKMDIINTKMNKINHKSTFFVVINEDNVSNDSSDNNSSSNDSDNNIIEYNDEKLFFDADKNVENEFGTDIDLFMRIPPKQKPKNKIVFHWHKKMDFNIKSVYKQINNKKLKICHIDNKYSIIDTNNFEVRVRRSIWDINTQNIKVNTVFEYDMNLQEFMNNHVWCILLCHGGKFAGCIYKGNQMIEHKTFVRYVTRKKQGKRQANFVSSAGQKGGKSAGGQKRKANEYKLLNEIRELLGKWKMYFINDIINRIYIHCPGNYNEMTIFGNNNEQEYLYPIKNGQLDTDLSKERINNIIKSDKNNIFRIYKKDKRIKKIPINTNNVTLKECQRIHHWLTTCWIKIKKNNINNNI